MSFEKFEWVDRLVAEPNRRRMVDLESGQERQVNIFRDEGNIGKEGTAFSAENMNYLETRISNMFPVSVENGGTGTTDYESIKGIGVGKSLNGQQVSPTSTTTVTAGIGSEIFNDYRERTFSGENALTGNIASGVYSHAEGGQTTASGGFSHAEGCGTIASSDQAHAEGYFTQAKLNASHAEGNSTIAGGVSSHAEGELSQANGLDSHAEGYNTQANGAASHAEGNTCVSGGDGSHAEGLNTTANGNQSHSEGYYTKALFPFSHAEGYHTTANNDSAHAEGVSTQATGNGSHAEGYNTIASGRNSHAEGNTTTSSGENSHAEGTSTQANGDHSHAEGNGTVTEGNQNHAEGYQTRTSNDSSHAEGAFTQATGNASHAEGNNTLAQGANSHAQGYLCKAIGDHSSAEGYETTANGGNSHAEGHLSQANNSSAHSEGESTIAGGSQSHAEGYYTQANGNFSHSEGRYNHANGINSHCGGYNNKANAYQTVIGKTNRETAGPTSDEDRSGDIFIVGGGGNTDGTRMNAMRVSTDGNVYALVNFHASGAGVAEMFEWTDRNTNREDRRGLFVTLDGEKIRIAQPTDNYILGVIDPTPFIVGDAQSEIWKDIYLKDVFGQKLTETVEVPETTDELGNVIPAHTETRYILNPEYNEEEEYISRESRPEFVPITSKGKVVMIDDGTCQVNKYCKVGLNGVATNSEDNYKVRVLKRIDNNHIYVYIDSVFLNN